MKKILRVSLTAFLVGVLFCVCFVTTAAAKTTSGKIDGGFTWTLDDQTGELTLSGNGDMGEDAFEEFQQKVLIPNKYDIKNIVIAKDIAQIYGASRYLNTTVLPNLQTLIHKLSDEFSWEKNFNTSVMTIKGKGKCPDLMLESYLSMYRWPTVKIDNGITSLGRNYIVPDHLIVGKDCTDILGVSVEKSYQIDPENPTYASYDGCLYTKNYTKLIRTYRQSRTPQFHPNLAIIEEEAFQMTDSQNNFEIVIPWGVTAIEGKLFEESGISGGPNCRVILPETLLNWNGESGGGGWKDITFLFQEGSQVFKSKYGTGEQYQSMPKEEYNAIYGITPNSLKTFQNGKTYYFDQNCKMAKGWKQASGNWYYFNDYGAAVVKIWLKSGNKWYFMQADGTMATNKWIHWYGKWYYVGSDGAMYANRWIKSSGKWYYLGSDGAMYTNRYTPDGYWVNGSGVWAQ